jgi:hypothetical protein
MPLYLDEIYLNASNPENAKHSLSSMPSFSKAAFRPALRLSPDPGCRTKRPSWSWCSTSRIMP